METASTPGEPALEPPVVTTSLVAVDGAVIAAARRPGAPPVVIPPSAKRHRAFYKHVARQAMRRIKKTGNKAQVLEMTLG